MKKIIIIVLVVAAVGVYFAFGNSNSAPKLDDTTNSGSSEPVGGDVSIGMPAPGFEGINEMIVEDVEPKTHIIRYVAGGFEPKNLTIRLGDMVTFERDPAAHQRMWVATDKHPTHTLYPGSDIKKCTTEEKINLFDQCGSGDTYTFTFNEVGEWAYHDHSNASFGGVIIVE